jgi:hypothetical protein
MVRVVRHTAPLLRTFLTGVTVAADGPLPGKTYDGTAASGTVGFTLSDPLAAISGSLAYASVGANAGNYSTGAGTLRFFVEHATNSSNVILRVCGNDLGLTLADAGRPMSAAFYAQSWYFGQTAPILGPYSISPGGEEFAGAVAGDQLAGKAKGDLLVQQYGALPGLTPQQGLLLVTNSDWGAASGNRGGATLATEGVILPR